jgi:hypothetical protein
MSEEGFMELMFAQDVIFLPSFIQRIIQYIVKREVNAAKQFKSVRKQKYELH